MNSDDSLGDGFGEPFSLPAGAYAWRPRGEGVDAVVRWSRTLPGPTEIGDEELLIAELREHVGPDWLKIPPHVLVMPHAAPSDREPGQIGNTWTADGPRWYDQIVEVPVAADAEVPVTIDGVQRSALERLLRLLREPGLWESLPDGVKVAVYELIER